MLRVGSVNHVRPQWAQLQPPHCWCDPSGHANVARPAIGAAQTSIVNEHIRLLGILLTEIATGSPVFDINRVAQTDGRTDVELAVVVGPTLKHCNEQLEDTLARIRQVTSGKYSEAVRYCLKNTKNPAQIEQTDVEEYYWEVFLPIQEYYNTLTRRPRLPVTP